MHRRHAIILLSVLFSLTVGQKLTFTSNRLEGLVREPSKEERSGAKTFSSIGEGMRAQPDGEIL